MTIQDKRKALMGFTSWNDPTAAKNAIPTWSDNLVDYIYGIIFEVKE